MLIKIINRHCRIEKRIFTFGNSAYSTFESGFNVDRRADCWLVSPASIQETSLLFRDSSSLVNPPPVHNTDLLPPSGNNVNGRATVFFLLLFLLEFFNDSM